MVASKKAQVSVCNVTVNRGQREQVDHFKYLGSWIISGRRSDIDIKCTISKAKQAFMDMRNALCAGKLVFRVRKRLLKRCNWSVLLYGFKSWQ